MHDILNKVQHGEELGYQLALDVDYNSLDEEFQLKLKYQ
jgi:hypothetical protein